MFALLLIACTATDDETASPVDTTPSDTSPADTSQDTAPIDADADGFTASEDCDDTDAAVYPGAVETWNEVDDDCDGRTDGDGSFAGDYALSASAIFKGTPYDWDLLCPAALTRAAGEIAFTVTCSPDPTDDMAMRMLGETLTLSGTASKVVGASWSGRCDLTSSDGWDTRSDVSITWSDLDHLTLAASQDAVSLDTSGSGELILGVRAGRPENGR